MKKSILLTIIALLFTSCAVSSLQIERNSELVLRQNSQKYALGSSQDRTLLRFTNLDITQNSIKSSSGNTLFYEQIIVDQAYEFSLGSLVTLKIIFDLSKSNLVYNSSSLKFLQLRVKENEYVNIVAETSALQDMSYVYGYTNEEFLNLAKSMGITIQSDKLENAVTLGKPITKWSQTRLIVEPILQPFDKRSMF